MRLFVGVEAPALPAVELPPGVRPVPAANLHVTVFFLGERSVAPALPAFEGARLRTGPVAWFGSALALEVEDLDGALGAVVAGGIEGWTPDGRPFRPHLTIGRLPRGQGRPGLPAAPGPVAWTARSLVLFASRGGRYEALARSGR